MKTKWSTISTLLAATLSASLLQAAPPAGFQLAATTPHFVFYTRGNASVEPKQAERFLTQVGAQLGHEVTEVSEYYNYERAEDLSALTGEYTTGVTYPDSGQIHSTASAQRHEIVHLVAGKLGSPARFFQEGLAVAIGDKGRLWGQDVNQIVRGMAHFPGVSALVAQFKGHDLHASYAVAGSFVSHLIKKYGMAKMADFFRSSAPGAETEVAFAATFGTSVAQAETDWRASL